MKIGLIQTGAIGDIFIAAPIAQWFIDRGAEVYWPIDSSYTSFVEPALPGIRFLPVDRAATGFRSYEYFVANPLAQLTPLGCGNIYPLYSALGNRSEGLVNPQYAASLKFDEYKYAIAGVPFQEKWRLNIRRDAEREKRLLDTLDLSHSAYVLRSEFAGCGTHFPIQIPDHVLEGRKLVDVSSITENPLDWLGAIERADAVFLVEGLFSNLVDQLKIGRNRHVKLRSSVASTPVLSSGWVFL
jgi:hypothetical protein